MKIIKYWRNFYRGVAHPSNFEMSYFFSYIHFSSDGNELVSNITG